MSTNKIKEYYRVKADIDLDAIHENVVNAKALTKPGTKLMAIIKADAYGHGAVMVAQTLEDVADAYGVAILEEGIELRQAGINKPILILGYTPAPLYSAMIKYDIATAVFEYDMAKKMSDTAEKMGKKAKVHIKLDTGMRAARRPALSERAAWPALPRSGWSRSAGAVWPRPCPAGKRRSHGCGYRRARQAQSLRRCAPM